MTEYIRNCPECGIQIVYKTKALYKQALKRNSKCKTTCIGHPKNKDNKICRKCREEKPKKEIGQDITKNKVRKDVRSGKTKTQIMIKNII